MAETTKSQTSHQATSDLPRLPQLAESILQFDLSSEIARLRQEDSWMRGTGRSSKTLAKYPNFRIVLTLLKADTRMHEHRTDAPISIQPVMGRIRLHLPGRTVELAPENLLVLDSDVPHDVEAIEESAFLLTVGWRHGTSK